MLPNTGIILTRPAAQAQAVARLIEAAGGRALLFPALEIFEHDPPPETHAILNDADIAIFISANAVEFGLRYVAINPLPGASKRPGSGAYSTQYTRLLRPVGKAHCVKFRARRHREK